MVFKKAILKGIKKLTKMHMNRQTVTTVIGIVVLVVIVALVVRGQGGSGGQQAAEQGQKGGNGSSGSSNLGKEEITLGIPPWPGARVKSHVVAKVLEKQGYDTKIKELDPAPLYT
ncbi:MAG: hypothetical protein ABEI13_02300, partial [Candidatus Paceibacteria bacterium]